MDMGDGDTARLCLSCWQLFAEYESWYAHADGPFADVDEASEASVTLPPGDPVPAGVRMGSQKCNHPGSEWDTLRWTRIADGDIVYDDESERFVGTVAHHDTTAVEVETPGGESRQLSRSDFVPPGRYRAMRL